MNTAVAQRPSFNVYPGPVIFPVFGAMLLGFTIYIWRVNGLHTFITEFFIAATAFLLLGALITGSRYLSYRVEASIHDHAVTFNGHDFLFDRIDSVALAEKARLGQWAKTVAMRRTLTITAEGKRRTFAWLAHPDGDPIAPILQLLLRRMANEAARRSLRGPGWSLELGTLRTKDESTPLSTVTSAIFDDEVRLWRRGEPNPFFATPITSPNALVLRRVAEDARDQAPAPTPVVDESRLGRLLFVRKPPGFINVLSAFAFGSFGASAAWYAADRWMPQLTKPVLIAAGLVTLYAVIRAILSFATRYRFHEKGMIATYAVGQRELRYADVARMRWQEQRNFTEGIYSGTSVKATLIAADGKPLHIDVRRFRTTDGDLEPLRHAMAHAVAARMRHELASTGRVAWTDKATLLRDGIELKRGVVIPYTERLNARFDDNGWVYFSREGSRKQLRMLNRAGENFEAGWILYTELTPPPSSRA